MSDPFTLSCPIPMPTHKSIAMAHGGGGRMMHNLLESIVIPAFRNSALEARHDSAVLSVNGMRLAFTTDSYVVSPHFFPGGDIGTLAVNGTINDLAMSGARPLCLSAAFVLEEGFSMDDFRRVTASMAQAAKTAGVGIVTGDTKVVDRGKGDGIFINTAGIGAIDHHLSIEPRQVRAGDAVILSGDIGRHGIAIMAVREGLSFETTIESDTASLWAPVAALLDAGIEIHCLRDLTRGGLASALVEIAEAAHLAIEIDERLIPVRDEVRAASELLGLDPLHVANEGRFVAFVPQRDAARCAEILSSVAVSSSTCEIGAVRSGTSAMVTARTPIGTSRIVDMLSGEQLPRIC